MAFVSQVKLLSVLSLADDGLQRTAAALASDDIRSLEHPAVQQQLLAATTNLVQLTGSHASTIAVPLLTILLQLKADTANKRTGIACVSGMLYGVFSCAHSSHIASPSFRKLICGSFIHCYIKEDTFRRICLRVEMQCRGHEDMANFEAVVHFQAIKPSICGSSGLCSGAHAVMEKLAGICGAAS
eukprot:scaffold91491_cov26-Prasinocladus_malaysianus.AAC.1